MINTTIINVHVKLEEISTINGGNITQNITELCRALTFPSFSIYEKKVVLKIIQFYIPFSRKKCYDISIWRKEGTSHIQNQQFLQCFSKLLANRTLFPYVVCIFET